MTAIASWYGYLQKLGFCTSKIEGLHGDENEKKRKWIVSFILEATPLQLEAL